MSDGKYVTKKFKKTDLQNLLWEDGDPIGEIVRNKMVDTSRWSIHYDLVFKVGEDFYQTSYRRGATESQDEVPFEYSPDEIECTLVQPAEKTIIEYKSVLA